MAAESPPWSSKSIVFLENLRIEMQAPSIASGGKTTLTRLPSGEAAVDQRARFVDAAADRGGHLLGDGGDLRPHRGTGHGCAASCRARSTKTRSGPLTMMSVMLSSLQQRLQRAVADHVVRPVPRRAASARAPPVPAAHGWRARGRAPRAAAELRRRGSAAAVTGSMRSITWLRRRLHRRFDAAASGCGRAGGPAAASGTRRRASSVAAEGLHRREHASASRAGAAAGCAARRRSPASGAPGPCGRVRCPMQRGLAQIGRARQMPRQVGNDRRPGAVPGPR